MPASNPPESTLREDLVGVLQHRLVSVGGADCRDGALTHAGQDGLLARAANQPVEVGPYGDTRDSDELDPVLGHGGHPRRVDHAGVDAGLHRLQHVAARQVDGGGPLPCQVDGRFVRGDHGGDHTAHVAACQVVGFHLVDVEVNPRLGGRDERLDDGVGAHLPQLHPDEAQQADRHTGKNGAQPQPDRDEDEDESQCEDNGKYEKEQGLRFARSMPWLHLLWYLFLRWCAARAGGSHLGLAGGHGPDDAPVLLVGNDHDGSPPRR